MPDANCSIFYSVFFSFVFFFLLLSLRLGHLRERVKDVLGVVVSRRVGRNISVTCVVSMRSKRIAIRRRRRRRAPSRRTNAPSALPRCSRHCSPILLRAAAATAHRRGAPKTMMMMMMIHASLFAQKSTLVFFRSLCVELSLSLSLSLNFLGQPHTKKKKKQKPSPSVVIKTRLLRIQKRVDSSILSSCFSRKINLSRGGWAFESDGRRRKANDKDARDRKLQKRGKRICFDFKIFKYITRDAYRHRPPDRTRTFTRRSSRSSAW